MYSPKTFCGLSATELNDFLWTLRDRVNSDLFSVRVILRAFDLVLLVEIYFFEELGHSRAPHHHNDFSVFKKMITLFLDARESFSQLLINWVSGHFERCACRANFRTDSVVFVHSIPTMSASHSAISMLSNKVLVILSTYIYLSFWLLINVSARA